MSGERVYFEPKLQLQPCCRVYYLMKPFIPEIEAKKFPDEVMLVKPYSPQSFVVGYCLCFRFIRSKLIID